MDVTNIVFFLLIFKSRYNQKTNFVNMLSTRIFFVIVLIIFSVLLPGNRATCQELVPLDTLDYLNPIFEGALENNLMVAASKGLLTEIDRLIFKGADINGESYQGATPLIFAVVNNQLGSVLKLLEYNPGINKMTREFETPLIISVKNQNVEIAEALIRNGADIDLADNYGAAPLHYAALNGSFYIADLLIYYEADCNRKTADGTTPLMAAIWAGYADIADLLFQNGANLEARDNAGFTPLLIAAQNGDTLMMNLLLDEGVDIYERNSYNYNALTLAIESNHKHAVDLLLKKGDRWTSAENEGVNPYTVAYSFGRKEIIELLERNNISGKHGLKIDEVTASASVKFNNRNYFTGLNISFKEPFYNAGFILGCDLKPMYTRILLKREENTYYQYFDRSSTVYGGIFKNFTISEYASRIKFAISTSLSAGYSFGGKFKGTNSAPENKIRIIPAAGISARIKHVMIKTDLEYMNTEFYGICPLWLRISIGYNYFLSKIMSPGKSIKWN